MRFENARNAVGHLRTATKRIRADVLLSLNFLDGKSPYAVDLYQRFAAAVERFGDVITAPAKTRVGFQVRMIFASVNRLNDDGLAAHLVLARRLEHPRFTKIESISPRNHVHHFILRDAAQVDAGLDACLREAHAVGKQELLK